MIHLAETLFSSSKTFLLKQIQQQMICGYLDPGCGSEDIVVRVFQTLLFEPLRLGADEQVEMCRQVASQQGFVGWDVEQEGKCFHIEAWLQHLQGEQTRGNINTGNARAIKLSSMITSLTISPPWTPLPLRFGAYSAKSTERSHSITRWLVHWEISAGVMLFWIQQRDTNVQEQREKAERSERVWPPG